LCIPSYLDFMSSRLILSDNHVHNITINDFMIAII
jgi:hypothetical protein